MSGNTISTAEPRSNVASNRAQSSTTPRRSAPPPTSSTSVNARGRDAAHLSGEAHQSERANPINFGAWSPTSQPASGESLRRGMESSQVREMQQSLKSKGMDLKVDGKFGAATQAAVAEYQRKNQLQVDGVVGAQTRGHLGEIQATPANAASLPAKNGASTHKRGDAFTFASNPQDAARVKQHVEKNKQNGQKTMVGIDPNNGPEEQQRLFKTARAAGAETHKYLEGRGGPTGANGWEKSEWTRTKDAAASLKKPIHLSSQSDSSPAMKEWNNRGWQEHSIKQAREAKKEGYDSIEVDNINRLNSGDNSQRTLDFYRQYAGEFAKGDMPTLLMKNQTAEELKTIHKGIQNYEKTRGMSPEALAKQPDSVRGHRLPREMFTDFAITEIKKGQKLPAEAESLANALGIRMLPSTNTYQYAADGRY